MDRLLEAAPPTLPLLQYRAVGEVEVPIVEYGPEYTDLPIVAAIHGLNGEVNQWGATLQKLSELGHHIVAVGLPKELGPQDAPRLHTYTRYLRGALSQFMERHQTEDVHLLGLSLGGLLAQQWGVEDGNVRKMIIAASAPATFAPVLDLPSLAAIRAINTPTRDVGHAATVYGGDFANGSKLPEELLHLADREIDRDHHYRQLEAGSNIGPLIVRSMAERGRLIMWSGPDALLWLGEGDPIIPRRTAKFGGRLLHMTTHEEVDGGHLFLLTRPETSAANADRFFRSLPLTNYGFDEISECNNLAPMVAV